MSDSKMGRALNDGTQLPDGSIWHNVMIMDKNGELVASYYISDASGIIKTVAELEAYAYN